MWSLRRQFVLPKSASLWTADESANQGTSKPSGAVGDRQNSGGKFRGPNKDVTGKWRRKEFVFDEPGASFLHIEVMRTGATGILIVLTSPRMLIIRVQQCSSPGNLFSNTILHRINVSVQEFRWLTASLLQIDKSVFPFSPCCVQRSCFYQLVAAPCGVPASVWEDFSNTAGLHYHACWLARIGK